MTPLSTTQPAVLIKAGEAHITRWLKLMWKGPCLLTKQHCPKEKSHISATAGSKDVGVDGPQKTVVWNQQVQLPSKQEWTPQCVQIFVHIALEFPNFCQIRSSVSVDSASIYSANNFRGYLKWQSLLFQLSRAQPFESVRKTSVGDSRSRALAVNGTMRSQEHA